MITKFLRKLSDKLNRGDTRVPYTYTIRDINDGSEYLTRSVFWRILGVRPLLHRFHRPDLDRHLHNHPWKWSLSIILCGSYTEERLGRGLRKVRWFNFLTDRDFHRVTELHGEVWTLFITGPRIQDWGFLIDNDDEDEERVVPHLDYFKALREGREP